MGVSIYSSGTSGWRGFIAHQPSPLPWEDSSYALEALDCGTPINRRWAPPALVQAAKALSLDLQACAPPSDPLALPRNQVTIVPVPRLGTESGAPAAESCANAIPRALAARAQ